MDRFVNGPSIRKYADDHQLNRGSVTISKRNSSLPGSPAERTGRGEGNMPTAETSTEVNNPTKNGAPATKQTLRFSAKCMS